MRRALLVVLPLLAATAPPATAQRGDDNLPRYNLREGRVSFPDDRVGIERAERLKARLEQATRDGVRVGVVLASQPRDIHPNEALYGEPQAYAEQLREDLRDPDSGRLPEGTVLVVMPTGLGAAGGGAASRTAIRSVPISLDARGDDLALAATAAIGRLAGADPSADEVDEPPVPWGALLVLAALTGAACATALRMRPPRVA